jgi:hypothetical protein
MNIIYFVLLVVSLTFAIGLSVAAIIWGINWLLSPDDQAHAIFKKNNNLSQVLAAIREMKKLSEKPDDSNQEYQENQELYSYHYGKN